MGDSWRCAAFYPMLNLLAVHCIYRQTAFCLNTNHLSIGWPLYQAFQFIYLHIYQNKNIKNFPFPYSWRTMECHLVARRLGRSTSERLAGRVCSMAREVRPIVAVLWLIALATPSFTRSMEGSVGFVWPFLGSFLSLFSFPPSPSPSPISGRYPGILYIGITGYSVSVCPCIRVCVGGYPSSVFICLCVSALSEDCFRSTQTFETKLGMIAHDHELECHASKALGLVW